MPPNRERTDRRRIRQGSTVACPLDMLVFLLPLIAFYEIAFFARSDRVIAFNLLQRFFEMFGRVGVWAPGLAVIVILAATHIASGRPWKVNWRRVGLMYLEAPLLAIPLLLINWCVPLATFDSSAHMASPTVYSLAQGVGAGIYEELVFRLILISVMLIVGVDLLRVPQRTMAVLAIVIASLIFALYHHQPFGHEAFDLVRFGFRTIAGVYLAIVFWMRGYAPAAGCHAAYNAVLILLG